MGRIVKRFFFSAGLCAFGAYLVRLQNFLCFKHLWNLGPSWTISDHIGPFQTIMDYFRPSWTILDHLEQYWTMAQFPDHFRPFPDIS